MMLLNSKDYLKSGYTIENNIVKDTYSEIYTEGQGVYPQKSTGLNEHRVTSYPTLYLK